MRYLFLIVFMLSTSCSTDDLRQNINIEAGTGFFVENELGEDLLNPNHPNSINFENIDIYHIVNNREVNAYNVNSDSPRGISLESPNHNYNKYYLSLGLNIIEEDEITYTIVQWDEENRDLFKVQFDKGNGYLISIKCWVNDKLVWDIYDGDERFFKLIK